MPDRYYSLGTAIPLIADKQMADYLSSSVVWILDQRNDDGTWGGPDSQDIFISTIHSVMVLLSIGISEKSELLKGAVQYLAALDKQRHLNFFWRSGVFVNLPEYESIVTEDLNYIHVNLNRALVHLDYPPLLFIYKCIRYSRKEISINFDLAEIERNILSEQMKDGSWYGRTSITTMAVNLLPLFKTEYDTSVLDRANKFLLGQLEKQTDSFTHNVIEDSFIVFNYMDMMLNRHSIGTPNEITLWLEKSVSYIKEQRNKHFFWSCTPPFGGPVQNPVYPTAVCVRALLSWLSSRNPDLSHSIIQFALSKARINKENDHSVSIRPLWGNISRTKSSNRCFVLMPFQDKLTQIYERYIKEPLSDQLEVACIRADDINASREIMRDIWNNINESIVIIAELTNHNINVYYELGMAHALGKNVVLISQNDSSLPFDIRGLRTIIYSDDPRGYEQLADRIVKYVKKAISENVNL